MGNSYIFSSLKSKLDIRLFVDSAEFPWILQFLHNVTLKLFCFDLQNNYMMASCKNWGIQGNAAKSTNNLMSSFGLIEKIWNCLILIKLYIQFLSGWFGQKVHNDLPTRPINQFKPVQQSRQQHYFPNIHTVTTSLCGPVTTEPTLD